MSQLNDLNKIAGEHVKEMREGVQAFTVQNYIEVNSKVGVQYETAIYLPSLGAGASYYVRFLTGTNTVAMKLVDIESTSESLSYQWFKNPTLTSNGTALIPHNLSDANPVAGAIQVSEGAVVTSEGVSISPEVHVLGQITQGSKGGGAGGVAGLERILAPNTEYLYKITNTNGTAQKVASYFTWYEGPLDFPK